MRLLLLISLFTSSTLFAQEIIITNPTKIAGRVNSNSEELSPILSANGRILYFARAFDPRNTGGESSGLDIWQTERTKDGQWGEPNNKLPWNNRLSNSVIGSSRSGKVIYLLNAYDHERGISFSTFDNGKWSRPETVPIKGLAVTGFTGFYMNPTFTVLLISMTGKDSYGKEDLYVSVKDASDNWGRPVNLGPTVNTEGFEMSPFLSEDMTRLYFSSDGHGGYGNADIFVAQRLYSDNWTIWTQPKNLGKVINSDKFDSYFSIYGDSVCFFSSNRESNQTDLYTATVTKKVDTVTYQKDYITFLTDKEIQKLAGANFNNLLVFNGTNLELTPLHKQQLTTAGKVMSKDQDLYLRLEVRIEPGSRAIEDNQKRLLNALRFLKTQGVEGSRVTFGSENVDGATPNETKVFIRFYR